MSDEVRITGHEWSERTLAELAPVAEVSVVPYYRRREGGDVVIWFRAPSGKPGGTITVRADVAPMIPPGKPLRIRYHGG